MKLIAIAGGIGSGKSLFSAYLRELGAVYLSADGINADLLRSPLYLAGLQERFPAAFSNGSLDKGKLRDIIYSDPAERIRLNTYAHPAVFAEMEERARQTDGTVWVEVPLLMEGEYYRRFDAVVAVVAPLEARITRIVQRNDVTEARAAEMIAAQDKEERVCDVATMIVVNDGSAAQLQKEAKRIFDALN